MGLCQRKERTERWELVGHRCIFSTSPALPECSPLLFFPSSLDCQSFPLSYGLSSSNLPARELWEGHSELLPFLLPMELLEENFVQPMWRWIFLLLSGKFKQLIPGNAGKCSVLFWELLCAGTQAKPRQWGERERLHQPFVRCPQCAFMGHLKVKQKRVAFHSGLSQHTLGVRSPHLSLPLGEKVCPHWNLRSYINPDTRELTFCSGR